MGFECDRLRELSCHGLIARFHPERDVAGVKAQTCECKHSIHVCARLIVFLNLRQNDDSDARRPTGERELQLPNPFHHHPGVVLPDARRALVVGASVFQYIVVYLGVWLGEGPGHADSVVTHLALGHLDLRSGWNCRQGIFAARNISKCVSSEAPTSSTIFFCYLSNSSVFLDLFLHCNLEELYFSNILLRIKLSENNLKLCL